MLLIASAMYLVSCLLRWSGVGAGSVPATVPGMPSCSSAARSRALPASVLVSSIRSSSVAYSSPASATMSPHESTTPLPRSMLVPVVSPSSLCSVPTYRASVRGASTRLTAALPALRWRAITRAGVSPGAATVRAGA